LDPEERHRHAVALWEAALQLLGAAAVVEYQARGAAGAPVGDLLARLDRLSLGERWRLVRELVRTLGDDDSDFGHVRGVLLEQPQRELPRTAALLVELLRALGTDAGPRAVVRLPELFDRLVQYRNRFVGHPDAPPPPGLFARMGPALLGGAADLFGRLDVLAGRRLVYVADVRQ